MCRLIGGPITHSTYTTKHAIRRLLIYFVYQNHAKNVWWTHGPFDLYNKTCNPKTVVIQCVSNHAKKKQTLGGHMTHSTHTTKHAIRRLLLYIVYQNHAKNVWRTHDPFDLHTETQKNPIILWHMVHQSHAKKCWWTHCRLDLHKQKAKRISRKSKTNP